MQILKDNLLITSVHLINHSLKTLYLSRIKCYNLLQILVAGLPSADQEYPTKNWKMHVIIKREAHNGNTLIAN